jgi:uncharacterized surface protein with fasciclin (FAS1) repeats
MPRKWIVAVAAVASLTVVAAACSDDGSEPAANDAETSMPAANEDAMAADQAEMTIAEVVASNPDFSTLLAAVGAADLGETLSGEGPFTVFAPTDEAFAALPEGTLDSLLEPEAKDDLAGILTYHVVSGEIMAADVQPGEVATVNGGTFTVSTDGGVAITDANGGTANVVVTDVQASNGVIHVIDAVLLP